MNKAPSTVNFFLLNALVPLDDRVRSTEVKGEFFFICSGEYLVEVLTPGFVVDGDCLLVGLENTNLVLAELPSSTFFLFFKRSLLLNLEPSPLLLNRTPLVRLLDLLELLKGGVYATPLVADDFPLDNVVISL